MSFANPAVECFAVYEPRLALNNKRYFAVIRGGNQITPYVFPVTAPSNSSLNFVCNPTSRNVIVDRAAQIRVGATTTFTGSRAEDTDDNKFPLFIQNDVAPRSWPIASITSTLNSSINGFGVVQQMSQVVHALECFNEFMELKNGWLSVLPQMVDNYQDYRLAHGTNNDPIGAYSTNAAQDPRGSYMMAITTNSPVVGNVPATAVINTNFYEWLMIPPWIFDGKQAGGLTNIDTLNFTFNLSNLPRMWSVCPPLKTSNAQALTGPVINNVNVNIDSADMILFFITPRITDQIPSEIVYPYYQIINYRSQQTTNPAQGISFNSTANLVQNPIQFQSIPLSVLWYAKQSDSVINSSAANMVYYTDSFMKINNFQVNWNNINGIYGGASVVQLYQTAVLNGLTMSFPEWNGSLISTDPTIANNLSMFNNYTTDYNSTYQFSTVLGAGIIPTFTKGGILKLCPGCDIPLRDDEAPGKLGVYNIQAQMGVTNINPYSGTSATVGYANEPYQPELNMVATFDGIMTIRHNSTIAQIGIVTATDCMTAPIRYDLNFVELERLYGGNFFEKIKSWGRKAIGAIKDYGPTVLKGLEYAAPLIGLGEQGAAQHQRHGGVLVGGNEGGAYLSHRDIRHRMKRI